MVLLDSDMLVLKNMDELMDLELDAKELQGNGERVFAAAHACVCNPLKRGHYPHNWYLLSLFFFFYLSLVPHTSLFAWKLSVGFIRGPLRGVGR